ncbi:MAG: glutamine synthetase, partial [Dehalococcoidia bacterium]|nr:glutamine synthetase [Dehalococcoidia bacterium]
LVPHQEAPTNVCWGDRNRSVLVRVPLGWLNVRDMARDANPQDKGEALEFMDKQTVEFRCPDGSANIHLLLAGLAVAARHGLEMEGALELARKLYVDVDISSPEHKRIQERLPQLPASCWESAENLLKDREIYQRDGVFSATVVDGVVVKLKGYDDKDLSERIYGKEDKITELVNEYLHC